jgi:hypothetical protein
MFYVFFFFFCTTRNYFKRYGDRIRKQWPVASAAKAGSHRNRNVSDDPVAVDYAMRATPRDTFRTCAYERPVHVVGNRQQIE